jgi:hypothetical protein
MDQDGHTRPGGRAQARLSKLPDRLASDGILGADFIDISVAATGIEPALRFPSTVFRICPKRLN